VRGYESEREEGMANFFVSYDLNGKAPTHEQMDEHLKKLGKCVHRVLETVWYIRSGKTKEQMYQYVNGFVSANDRVLVIEAADCTWRNLLVADTAIQGCWNA
jgi:hypothetical protein